MMDAGSMYFFLLVGHALADYPLQGDFLAQAKNRNTAIGKTIWIHALPAHALIHGGFVALITGQVWIGCLEVIAHGAIDWFKCENRISFSTDQFLHIACKALWLAIVFKVLP